MPGFVAKGETVEAGGLTRERVPRSGLPADRISKIHAALDPARVDG
jgi:hypothetical protein